MHFTENSLDTKCTARRMVCVKCPLDVELPPELVEQILSHAWLSNMHPDERRQFASSVSLVSRLWRASFTVICATDIYILSTSGFEHFRNNFDSRNPSYPSLNNLCRTAAREIAISPLRKTSQPAPRGRVGGGSRFLEGSLRRHHHLLLETFRLLPLLPNLRTLSVSCFPPRGAPPPLSIDHAARLSAPVVHLELEYTLAPDTPAWLAGELGLGGARWDKPRGAPWTLPDLEHVSFADDPARGAAEVLAACPHLRLAGDEAGRVRVRVLRASRVLARGAAIVHGAMEPVCWASADDARWHPARDGRIDMSDMTVAPRLVRGTALGLILGRTMRERRCPVMDEFLHHWRAVHVFMPN